MGKSLKNSSKSITKLKLSEKNSKNQTKISSFFQTKPQSALTSTKTTQIQPDLKKFSLKEKLLVTDTGNEKFSSPTCLIDDDSSSDIEIIEPTPEVQRKHHSKLKVSCALDDSLDFIPSTPQVPINRNKSILKSGNLSKLSTNLSLNARRRIYSNDVKTSSKIAPMFEKSPSCSRKRLAETKTGVSPNAKKCNEAKAENTTLNKSSKINLLSRLSSSNTLNTSNTSERSLNLFDTSSELPQSKKDKEDELLILNLLGDDTTLANAPKDTISLKGDQNHKNNINTNKTKKSTSLLSDSAIDDDLLKELLSDDFNKLSPFKDTKSVPVNNITSVNKGKELIGNCFKNQSQSVIEKGDFGRFTVVEIENEGFQRELKLQLKCSSSDEIKVCYMSGFWAESAIKEDDVIHIISYEQRNDGMLISDKTGLVVINPDYLVSGTSVVSGVFCRRKAVLNERFKGFDTGNKIMLIGTLVHQLFQEAVLMKAISEEKLAIKIEELIHHPSVLRNLFGLNVTVKELTEEISKFISPIVSWIKYYLDNDGTAVTKSVKKWHGKIDSIQDIEENLWSPKYGIKGKIDLTVKIKGSNKIMPLELKTGRASFSAEHQGQVTLYSMMSSDRRVDSQAGLLLYLRDGSMSEISVGEREKKGLIQLRNEIVSHLTNKPSENDSKSHSLPALPQPLNSDRACSKCPHLLSCCALQEVSQLVPETPHAMASLVPLTLNHLKEKHLDYFRRWCLLLHLEIAANKRSAISDLWCVNPEQREKSGDCLHNLILDERIQVESNGTNQFIHTFIRNTKNSSSVLPSIFQSSESIVVSSERELAMSLGVVISMEHKRVVVVLDRNLKLKPLWKKRVFRIDRCEYQNTMSAFFTNLARLIEDSPRTEKLRRLIIDKEPPSFAPGVDRQVLGKITSALKDLNKNQQRAVLRAMLANDFCLLKGFPGTGKTSTIVGLVRLLHSLGKSVLITSYTHSAVDNILLKLKPYAIPFLRLGRISRIHADVSEFSDEKLTRDFKTISEFEEFYNENKIVATTCLGMTHELFTRKTFDYCIMDEAAQVLQAAALSPLFFCDRFIMVGDALQLPPIVKSHTAKSLGMMESMFEYLDNSEGTISLVHQYRMNGPIMAIANYLTYDGQLQCATAELESSTLKLPYNLSVPCWASRCISCNIDDSVVFMDTSGEAPEEKDQSNQPTNPRELLLIQAIVSYFCKGGLATEDIGIITPYRAQVKILKEQMRNIEVNTVDQYQGRDKDVILYSCVKSGLSQNDIRKGEILQDVRRLNVAITRAKFKLIILGDLNSLKFYEPFEKIFQVLRQEQIYKLKSGADDLDWDGLSLGIDSL